jgi:hypothetical protein
MPPTPPDAKDVWIAIETYLDHAYGDALPLSVKSQLSVLRSFGGPIYKSPVFVPDAHDPPTRYFIRFGNRFYPHMKLVIELRPGDTGWQFKADAHDRHVCPLEKAPEYAEFKKLMDSNQQLVDEIEADWGKQGLPTFKAYLREDLARRQAANAQNLSS